jgi:hypothetical protein
MFVIERIGVGVVKKGKERHDRKCLGRNPETLGMARILFRAVLTISAEIIFA